MFPIFEKFSLNNLCLIYVCIPPLLFRRNFNAILNQQQSKIMMKMSTHFYRSRITVPIWLPCLFSEFSVEQNELGCCVFLAVQDSSIGDLVTLSLRHLLISDFWETFVRLLRDYWGTFERLLRDFWGTFERLLRDFWETFERLLRDFLETLESHRQRQRQKSDLDSIRNSCDVLRHTKGQIGGQQKDVAFYTCLTFVCLDGISYSSWLLSWQKCFWWCLARLVRRRS